MTPRLLIMACSATKKNNKSGAAVPARQLYDGPSWRVYRNWREQYSRASLFTDVMVCSAEYGLISELEWIEPYDRRMDVEQARKLSRMGRFADQLDAHLRSCGDPEVLVFGSTLYASVVSAWMPADYQYRCVCDGARGIGDMLGELKAWLHLEDNSNDNINQLQLVGNL